MPDPTRESPPESTEPGSDAIAGSHDHGSSPDAIDPAERRRDVLLLKVIFGTAIFAWVVFVGMMVTVGPRIDPNAVRGDCLLYQDKVREAIEELCKRRSVSFASLLAAEGRGSTLGPLFKILAAEGLLAEPFPRTTDCRSFKDYTVLDPQSPTLLNMACWVHGQRDPGRSGVRP